jgi:hypothetical protein
LNNLRAVNRHDFIIEWVGGRFYFDHLFCHGFEPCRFHVLLPSSSPDADGCAAVGYISQAFHAGLQLVKIQEGTVNWHSLKFQAWNC